MVRDGSVAVVFGTELSGDGRWFLCELGYVKIGNARVGGMEMRQIVIGSRSARRPNSLLDIRIYFTNGCDSRFWCRERNGGVRADAKL